MTGDRHARRWGVVGGGMLGLTLAHRLVQQGHEVTLLEGADRLGGLASSWQLGDIVWDRHYHVTLESDSCLRRLLSELDLESEIRWTETRTACYANQRLYSVSTPMELLKLPVLPLVDRLRIAATLAYGSRIRNGKRLERILVRDWLARWSGLRAFDRFWLPLLKAKLGDNYRETAAAFIWATMRRLGAARRSGLDQERFGYVPGGYARVLSTFGAALRESGVRIELGARVEAIGSQDGTLSLRQADGLERAFERIAITAAPSHAASLCPTLTREERDRLLGIRYQGIVCASLLLDRPLAGYYLTNILDRETPFTGVVEMTALVDPQEFGGRHLIYLPRYLAADDPYVELSDAEVERRFLAALELMYPTFRHSQVLGFRVSRVRNVFAVTTLDYSRLAPPVTTSVRGLYLVNSAQIVNATLNVNETVQLAEAALPTLLAETP